MSDEKLIQSFVEAVTELLVEHREELVVKVASAMPDDRLLCDGFAAAAMSRDVSQEILETLTNHSDVQKLITDVVYDMMLDSIALSIRDQNKRN